MSHSETTYAEIGSVMEPLWLHLWLHLWLRFGTPSGFSGSKLIHLFGTWWLHSGHLNPALCSILEPLVFGGSVLWPVRYVQDGSLTGEHREGYHSGFLHQLQLADQLVPRPAESFCHMPFRKRHIAGLELPASPDIGVMACPEQAIKIQLKCAVVLPGGALHGKWNTLCKGYQIRRHDGVSFPPRAGRRSRPASTAGLLL